jgi:hypothetical protein
MSKLQHAFLIIPAGWGLLSPFYALLAIEPQFVYLHRNQHLFNDVIGCHTFLREPVGLPTKYRNLVQQGWPDYVGITDASGHGVGGCIMGENAVISPMVFQYQWPSDITNNIVSDDNPIGRITNSDLEMVGLLMLWLVLEGMCPTPSQSSVTTHPLYTGYSTWPQNT